MASPETAVPAPCGNCSHPSECTAELRNLVWQINRHLWNVSRKDQTSLENADLYTIVILCLFAGIILILMVRSIRPSESIDDQVTILLNSMRVRVDYEDNARQRRKLREAKKRAQRWLTEAKLKSVKKLSFNGSFRNRSTSETDAVPEERLSLKSNPTVRPKLVKPLCQRAASYQFLPEIVVTSTPHQPDFSPPSTRCPSMSSRASSIQSYDDMSQGSSTACKEVYSVV